MDSVGVKRSTPILACLSGYIRNAARHGRAWPSQAIEWTILVASDTVCPNKAAPGVVSAWEKVYCARGLPGQGYPAALFPTSPACLATGCKVIQ